MYLNIENFKVGAPVPLSEDITAMHPDYIANISLWEKNRRFAAGASEVKRHVGQYLPKLDSHKDENTGAALYAEYADRAILHPAVGETIKMYLGLIFQKRPEYQFIDGDLPDFTSTDIFEDASQDEENYDALLHNICREIITVNRVGVLEDMPELDNGGEMTIAERERLGITSYSVIYTAESIINWGYAYNNGRKQMTFYILKESFFDQSTSLMNPVKRDRYRILALAPELIGIDDEGSPIYGDKPVYHQIVCEDNSDGNPIVVKMNIPKKNGEPFEWIPFFVINISGNKPAEVKPPVFDDLVELSKGHFRNSADYEQELHILAVKTAIFPGMTKSRQEEYGDLRLGGAIGCPEGQEPFFLEATSNSAIANEMKAKEERMAIIGSQGLAPVGGRYVQSERTSEIQSSSDASIIELIANTIEQVGSELLTLKLEWSIGFTGIAKVTLKKDYFMSKLTPEMLPYIIQVIQAGGVFSKRDLFNVLKRMDIISPDASFEEAEKESDKSFGALTQLKEQLAAAKASLAAVNGAQNETDKAGTK